MANNYWIGDASGRVLGPLTLQALRDLVGSGRLRKVTRASRDGDNWVPIQDFVEVRDLLTAAQPSPAAEQQQAEQLRAQLRGLQGLKTPHEVFGMRPTATLDEVRLAFFRMAKKYSPEHLPPEAHPELRKASQETFDFLSQKMRELEARTPPAPAGRPLTPVPLAGRPLPGATAPMTPASPMATQVRKQIAAPVYSSEEFVGLKARDGDKVQAEIRVSPRNVGIFTEHRLINLTSGGLFIATHRPLRIGTKVDLTLRFEQPPRAIEVRSAVIWEHALNDGRQPQGYGLGLSGLRPEEKTFLQEFVRTHTKA